MSDTNIKLELNAFEAGYLAGMLIEYDGFADGNPVTDTAYCPSCEHEFEEDSENWTCAFCPNCGQRLRWE